MVNEMVKMKVTSLAIQKEIKMESKMVMMLVM
jgi:hypothetical protein